MNSIASTSGSHSTTKLRSPHNSPNGNGIVLPQAPFDIVNAVSMSSPESQFRGSTGSPELHQSGSFSSAMQFPGWNPELPDPVTLNH